MAQSLDGWFKSLGPITQKLTILILAISLGGTLGLVDPRYMVLDFEATFKKLQVWRLVTNMFFFGLFAGPQAFSVLINIYLFIMYSNRLEEGHFKGKTADLLWMFITTGVLLVFVAGYFLEAMTTSRGILLVVVWAWCRYNPDESLNVMGMFAVKSLQFPWVLMGMHWLFGQGWIPDAVGIFAGHVWIYLREILPETHGWNLLPTPQFIRNRLPDQRVMGGFSSNGYMPASRQAATATSTTTKSWSGQGRVLGTD